MKLKHIVIVTGLFLAMGSVGANPPFEGEDNYNTFHYQADELISYY